MDVLFLECIKNQQHHGSLFSNAVLNTLSGFFTTFFLIAVKILKLFSKLEHWVYAGSIVGIPAIEKNFSSKGIH